jgi:hypothetical protein
MAEPMGEGGIRYWAVQSGWVGVEGEVQKKLVWWRSGYCVRSVCPEFLSVYVEEASRRCSEPGHLPTSYYLDASVFLLPP